MMMMMMTTMMMMIMQHGDDNKGEAALTLVVGNYPLLGVLIAGAVLERRPQMGHPYDTLTIFMPKNMSLSRRFASQLGPNLPGYWRGSGRGLLKGFL